LQGVILLAVVELVSKTAAYFDVEVRRDRQVTSVEQRVDILTKQEPIRRAVASAVCVGPNVGGIEHVQDMGIGESTLPLIDIGHDDPECALPESGHNRLRLPKPRTVSDQFRLHCQQGTRTICSTSSVMCTI
jgi:hypothetical protein